MADDPRVTQFREVFAPLSNLQIDGVLGEGGMGVVLLGRDTMLDVPVAIKVMNNPRFLKSKKLRVRFRNEARAMVWIKDPGVVQVMALNEIADMPYIVMEVLYGGDLMQHYQMFGPLHPRQVAHVACGVLNVLEKAHGFERDGEVKPIIHRDIKPENIMLTRDGRTKVMDFGVAHVEHMDDELAGAALTRHATKTRVGDVMGTMFFMSPEQRRGAADIDGRTDLHALGACMWMLSKQLRAMPVCYPYELFRERESFEEMDPALVPIILKACAQDRDDRYATAAEMREALEAVVDELAYMPADTPALGSAPREREARRAQKAARELEAIDAAAAARVPEGATMVPDADGGGIRMVSEEPRVLSDVPHPSLFRVDSGHGLEPLGTMAPEATDEADPLALGLTQFGDDERLAAEAAAAKNRRVLMLAGLALLVMVGIPAAWFVWPETPVEAEPVIETPVVEIEEPVVEPKIEPEEVEVTSPEIDEVIEDVAPEPVKISKVKAKVPVETEPVVVEVEPEIEEVVEPVVETGLVRLSIDADDASKIYLRGTGGSFALNAGARSVTVPVGDYQLFAQYAGQPSEEKVGTFRVDPGIATLTCNGDFANCQGKTLTYGQ